MNENGLLAVYFAQNIIRENNQMLTQVRALERSRHTISIGSCAPGPIMDYVPQISGLYSDKTIMSEIKKKDALVEGLYKNEYQIIILDQEIESPDLYSKKCGTEKLFLYATFDHHLAGEDSVSFSQLNGEYFLMVSEVGIWDKIVSENMPDSKFLLQDDLESLYEVSKASTLSIFATDITLRIFGQRNERIFVPFSDDAATVTYYCICKKENLCKYREWIDSLN